MACLCVRRIDERPERRETATHGGWEQQMPAQEAVITLGLPSLSYVPTTRTGVGYEGFCTERSFHNLREL